jgi:hypothetical protein
VLSFSRTFEIILNHLSTAITEQCYTYLGTTYYGREKLNECLTDQRHVFVYDEVEFVKFGKWRAQSVVSCGSLLTGIQNWLRRNLARCF